MIDGNDIRIMRHSQIVGELYRKLGFPNWRAAMRSLRTHRLTPGEYTTLIEKLRQQLAREEVIPDGQEQDADEEDAHEGRQEGLLIARLGGRVRPKPGTPHYTTEERMWTQYRRTAIAEMRPYIPGEDLAKISVSKEDHPQDGGMIARNPDNHDDQWYVNGAYFAKHFEPIA